MTLAREPLRKLKIRVIHGPAPVKVPPIGFLVKGHSDATHMPAGLERNAKIACHLELVNDTVVVVVRPLDRP